MATNELENPIENYDEPWEGHTGLEVENFIKDRLKTHEESLETSAQATKYVVQLLRDGSDKLVTIGGTATVRLRFASISLTPNGTTTPTKAPTNEEGTLTVESRATNTNQWVVRKTLTLASVSDDSTAWTEIDLAPYLPAGAQTVKLTVKGQATELTTASVLLQVVKTSLALEFRSQWERPVTDGVLCLQYGIDGAVPKTLHVKVDGGSEMTYSLGSATYSESPYQLNVGTEIMGAPLSHGIHNIEAWLTVDGSTAATPRLLSQMFVQADSSDTGVHIAVNEAATKLTNWVSQTLLRYAVFCNGATAVPLAFKLTDQSGGTELMSFDAGQVPTKTMHSLTNVLEVNTEQLSQTVKLQFLSGATQLRSPLTATLASTNDFAPVSGAHFQLNPRTRTNNAADRATVVNAANGQAVEAAFTGMAFVTDGWMADANGQRCLRVPSGASVNIDYETFGQYIENGSADYSLTVELDIASRNAYDLNEAILRMCTKNDAGRTVGIELCPREAALLTASKQERGEQNVFFCEGERTHIVFNMVYDIDRSGKNFVRVFINGVPNREFEWEASDRFAQNVDGTVTSKGIRIGSNSADIDVYGIRVYRRALTAAEIRRNYMSTMGTTAEKVTFRDANAITGQDGTIDYELARDRYNTILITGEIPNYFNRADTVCDWDINIIGDPEHSCLMTAMATAGQGTSSKSYGEWNLSAKKTDTSKIIDRDGNERPFDGYQLDNSVPKATKLVGKLNWASSMQSHKMGACNLINDLRRAVGDPDSILAADPMARVAVKQKPFLVFVRDNEQTAPSYHAVFTFGPGKGDPATFGYKKTDTDYLQIEGADNGEPLTNHHMPWTAAVEYDSDKESYIYAGAKQWDPVMGNMKKIGVFADANNFVYSCSPLIKPFEGSLEDMWSNDTAKSEALSGMMFWPTVPGSSNAYDLYRWDKAAQQWVDAGTEYADGAYGKMNLKDQLGETPSADSETANAQFIAKRLELFKAGFEQYYHKTGMLFSQTVRKLLALSDNWAKNTYQYLAKQGDRLIISEAFDDNDTMGPVENVGRTNKPYYVEEHDVAPDGKPYWNADTNALYVLIEKAYPGELRHMMNTVLSKMQELGGSLEGCIDKYFFSTQRYLPAVVYSENARLHYERYEKLYGTGKGFYTASVHPLAQSLGNLLECERQWWKDRLVYLSSYAGFGQFAMNGAGSMTFRSVNTTQGSVPQYAFALTPHMWLYPSVTVGSSPQFGSGRDLPVRTKAGERVTIGGLTGGVDVNIQLHGIDYYDEIGQFGNKPLGADFTVSGAYLTEFIANAQPMEFRPTSLKVTAPNLKKLDLRNVATLAGELNLKQTPRLQTLDLTGTRLTGFTLANPAAMKSLSLPATVEKLHLDGYTALEQSNLTFASLGNVTELTLSNSPLLDGKAIAERLAADGAPLAKLSMNGISWNKVKTSTLTYLANRKIKYGEGIKLTGKVVLAPKETITMEQRNLLNRAFGDIDANDPAEGLLVDYSANYVTLQSVRIGSLVDYIELLGDYQMQAVMTPTNANTVKSARWSIDSEAYATINEETGVLTVLQTGDESLQPKATVTLDVTQIDGTHKTTSFTVHFFARQPMKIFDPVYHDGTYGIGNGEGKTLIGICFDVITMQDRTQRRKIFALKDIGTTQWGPTADLKDGSGKVVMEADVPCLPTYGDYIGSSNPSPGSMWDANAEKWKPKPYGSASADIGDKYLSADEEMATLEPTYRRTTVYDSDSTLAKPGASQIVPTGTVMTTGQYYTRKLIHDRNGLMVIFNKTIPAAQYLRTEWEDLAIKRSDGYYNNQGFGAFSLCYAYEPALSNVNHIPDLIPEARVHNWYLPTIGELMQVICCMTMIGQAVEGDKLWPLKQMIEQGVLAQLGGNTWSSSEHSKYNAWYCSPGGSATSSTKFNTYAVRPVAAF